jgi:hypothetical protein
VFAIIDSDEESMHAQGMNATKRVCKIEDSDEEMYETNISVENSLEEVLISSFLFIFLFILHSSYLILLFYILNF